MNKFLIHTRKIPKMLLIANVVMTIIYYMWWLNFSHAGNMWLYGLLFVGETYHVGMSFLFFFTIWPKKKKTENILSPLPYSYQPSVDIFITVANEPLDIIRETAIAAKQQNYQNKRVYILNDGYVAKRKDWMKVEELAWEIGISCITRKTPGGAKAGNINNALRLTDGEIIVIFDADMVSFPYFLDRMIPYFSNANLAFVQSPQYYKNFETNEITSTSWEQQELFYGPIMQGKDSYNSAFICGTNVAIKRAALDSVGGMVEDNVTEDFLTSVKIHQKGFQSVYLTEVLATGLAPEDLLSYFKQQRRWARGSLEVLFSQNPFFKKGLTFSQKLQYLASALYYLNGLIILIDISMPLLYLYFGWKPVTSTTLSFGLYFIPSMFLNLLTLYLASGKQITFRALAFSQSSFSLQLSALFSALFRVKDAFAITPKRALSGNFSYLAYPHIFYVVAALVGMFFAIHREGFNASLVTNISWSIFNIYMFYPFIKTSFDSGKTTSKSDNTVVVDQKMPTLSAI